MSDERQTMTQMRAFIGKRVTATLAETPQVVAETGRLVAINDGGELTIMHDDGFVTYCWPALSIAEAPIR